jgi:hypothetical protein
MARLNSLSNTNLVNNPIIEPTQADKVVIKGG